MVNLAEPVTCHSCGMPQCTACRYVPHTVLHKQAWDRLHHLPAPQLAEGLASNECILPCCSIRCNPGLQLQHGLHSQSSCTASIGLCLQHALCVLDLAICGLGRCCKGATGTTQQRGKCFGQAPSSTTGQAQSPIPCSAMSVPARHTSATKDPPSAEGIKRVDGCCVVDDSLDSRMPC